MLLAFDTTTDACSAAAFETGRILAVRCEPMRRGHAEALLPMIQALMADLDRPMSDVARIAVTTGPGSFTGVRVGIAAARGLALALDVPAAGFSTLETLAAAAGQEAERRPPVIVAAIAGRGGQLYAQAFGGDLEAMEPPALMEAEAAKMQYSDIEGLAVGSAADALAQGGLQPVALSAPLAQALALHAAQAGDAPWQAAPSPLYLRPADAKPPAQPSFARRR